MTASIISLPAARQVQTPAHNEADDNHPDPFDTYVGCLMSASYALSGLLLPSGEYGDQQHRLTKFVDDPELLARIATHPSRRKLTKLLLGYTLLEHARHQLWFEIEGLLAAGE